MQFSTLPSGATMLTGRQQPWLIGMPTSVIALTVNHVLLHVTENGQLMPPRTCGPVPVSSKSTGRLRRSRWR